MTTFGYARVSTRDQDFAGQVAELTAAGCAKVFREKASGAKRDRAELTKVIAKLEVGDVLAVTRLDRLARSTRDLLNVIESISSRGAGFKSLKDAFPVPALALVAIVIVLMRFALRLGDHLGLSTALLKIV